MHQLIAGMTVEPEQNRASTFDSSEDESSFGGTVSTPCEKQHWDRTVNLNLQRLNRSWKWGKAYSQMASLVQDALSPCTMLPLQKSKSKLLQIRLCRAFKTSELRFLNSSYNEPFGGWTSHSLTSHSLPLRRCAAITMLSTSITVRQSFSQRNGKTNGETATSKTMLKLGNLGNNMPQEVQKLRIQRLFLQCWR